MKDKLLLIFKMFIFVIASSLVFAVFLVLCYLDEVNYTLTVDEFEQEGWYTNVLELRPGYDQNFFSEEPGIQPVTNDLSDYLRAAGLSGRGPLYDAMAMTDGNDHYARYWHGYAGILRILLQFFDGKEIKYLSFAFQLLFVVVISALIFKREGMKLMLLFLTQYVLLMPLAVSVSMVFAFSIDIALLGILLILCCREKTEKLADACFFFCAIGMLTCFFEELVFGILTWGMVILWLIIFNGKNAGISDNILKVIATGLSWVWGYGGVWFMKWIYATAVMKENIIADGLGSVFERSSSNNNLYEVKDTLVKRLLDRFSALGENYKYYFYTVFFLILLIWVIYLLYKLFRSNITTDSRIPALGIVALAPAVWYYLLANHTLGHRFMTYRIWNFGIIAVFAIVLIASEVRASLRVDIKFKVMACAVSALFAFACAGLKTEEAYSRNLDGASEPVFFSEFENGYFSIPVVPQYKEIRNIGLILQPETTEGEYEFRLIREGNVVYAKTVSMEVFYESPWQMVEFDWKVKPGTGYILEIVPVCKEGLEGSVTLSIPSEIRLGDVGDIITEDGDHQLYCWIIYHKGVEGRKWIFYFLSWYMVCMSLFLVIRTVFSFPVFKSSKMKENK